MRLSAPRHCGGRCQRRTTSVLRAEPGVPGAAASRTVFDTGYYSVFVKTTSNNRGFGPTGPLKNNRNVGLTDAWRGAQPLQPRGCLPLAHQRCLRQSRQTARVHIFRTAWRTAAAICGAVLPGKEPEDCSAHRAGLDLGQQTVASLIMISMASVQRTIHSKDVTFLKAVALL